MAKASVIKQQELVDAFNGKFKVGDTVQYRKFKGATPVDVTVYDEAFLSNSNNAVVFFQEISGYCSIEPMFVIYK